MRHRPEADTLTPQQEADLIAYLRAGYLTLTAPAHINLAPAHPNGPGDTDPLAQFIARVEATR